MSASAPSATNVFTPTFDGQLVIDYSRNEKKFALNQYISQVPVNALTGYYLRITPDNAIRILSSNLADIVWPDGNDAPTGEWNQQEHEFFAYLCTRYAPSVKLGYQMAEQAMWDIKKSHQAMLAQQVMTARSIKAMTVLTDTAQYASTHTATATASGGGYWSAGTLTAKYIQKSIQYGARQITLDTNSVVNYKDLVLIVNPKLAVAMATSSEISEYLAQSPVASEILTGEGNLNSAYGLPPQLYGVKLVVEDASKVVQQKGATAAPEFILGDTTAVLVARPGSLTSNAGGISFSTLTMFVKEDMQSEMLDDPNNRRHLIRIVDNYDIKVTAPATGYVFTACTA